MTFCLVTFFLVWILVQSQTYRKRCIWAHRAYAQVGSKIKKKNSGGGRFCPNLSHNASFKGKKLKKKLWRRTPLTEKHLTLWTLLLILGLAVLKVTQLHPIGLLRSRQTSLLPLLYCAMGVCFARRKKRLTHIHSQNLACLNLRETHAWGPSYPRGGGGTPYIYIYIWPIKKIFVFQVTRPTHGKNPRLKKVYGTFGPISVFRDILCKKMA